MKKSNVTLVQLGRLPGSDTPGYNFNVSLEDNYGIVKFTVLNNQIQAEIKINQIVFKAQSHGHDKYAYAGAIQSLVVEIQKGGAEGKIAMAIASICLVLTKAAQTVLGH